MRSGSQREIGYLARALPSSWDLDVLEAGLPLTGTTDQVITVPSAWENALMTMPTDAFRRFQAELAALDASRPSKKTMELAKEEFLALRKRYGADSR